MNLSRKFLHSEESFEYSPNEIVVKEFTNERLGRIPEILSLYHLVIYNEQGKTVFDWTLKDSVGNKVSDEYVKWRRIFFAKMKK